MTCEQRVGDLHSENPDIQRAVQEIFATTDVVAESDVAARYERLLTEDSALEYAQATVDSNSGLPGYGTIEDVIYGMAVRTAVNNTVNEELVDRGFFQSDEQYSMSLRGQSLCGEVAP